MKSSDPRPSKAGEVLEAPQDNQRWREALAELPAPLRDVYFTPEYLELHRSLQEGARALLFRFKARGEVWAYPFLLRPILAVGGGPPSEPMSDIESAYGYGGPVATTDDPGFLSEAHRAFSAWCAENKVVAEFVRLHPLLGNERWLPAEVERVLDRHTVSVDLSAPGDGDPPFDKPARNAVSRALRGGMRVRECSAPADFERFRELYLATMREVGADRYYEFSPDYFRGLEALVRARGLLLCAELGGECVAAATFLKGPTLLHYHLAGSKPGAKVPGAGNLLILEAARAGARAGLQGLHLGGGRTPTADDSLLKFKRSMGSGSHAFFIGKRVHDSARYASLVKQWRTARPGLAERYGGRLLCYRYGAA